MEEKNEFKKKEFRFKGKTLEELKELSVREFAKLINSKNKRTALRKSDDIQRFLLKCKKKLVKNKPIKTHTRELIIVPKMVGLKISIHNGKKFVPIEIKQEMLGHRLGEFVPTRTPVKHGAAGVGATRSSSSMSVK